MYNISIKGAQLFAHQTLQQNDVIKRVSLLNDETITIQGVQPLFNMLRAIKGMFVIKHIPNAFQELITFTGQE